MQALAYITSCSGEKPRKPPLKPSQNQGYKTCLLNCHALTEYPDNFAICSVVSLLAQPRLSGRSPTGLVVFQHSLPLLSSWVPAISRHALAQAPAGPSTSPTLQPNMACAPSHPRGDRSADNALGLFLGRRVVGPSMTTEGMICISNQRSALRASRSSSSIAFPKSRQAPA